MGILMGLYITLFMGMIFLGIFAYGSIVSAILFAIDKTLVFFVSFYYIHHYFSVKVASGKAIYFWDILLSIIPVVIYSVLFHMIHSKFFILGKILNFAISYLGVLAAYYFVAGLFVKQGQSYFFPLLNNESMNKIAHYVLAIIPAIVVWFKREDGLTGLD